LPENFSIWIPSTGEEKVLNLVALALVLLLVALGFDVLKLPATIAPNRAPIPQLIGLLALLVLNLVLFWTVARDDYVRFGYGFPRVVATFAFLSVICSVAILIRGLWDGTYALDPTQPLLWNSVLGISIAGQFTAMAFCATYLLKKTDNAKVREFKRLAKAVRGFVEAIAEGNLRDDAFEDAFAAVSPDMRALPETARAARLALNEPEAEYASNFATASNRLAELLDDVPTVAISRGIAILRKDEEALFVTIVGRNSSGSRGNAET